MTSSPVLFRGQPLDQSRTSSPLETSSPLCRETRCASTPTTRTSSSRPATRRRGALELTNVQKWAARYNLKLNFSKSTEVIFRDHRRRRHHAPAAAERPEPAPLPGIARSSCLKMLDVSIENIFSIAQHVKRLVTARAQSVYALRVLRLVGWTTTLCSTSTVPYHRRRSSDVRRQRVARSHQSATPQAHRLCAGSRSTPRVCPADLPTLDELCNIADDELFGRSMRLSITMSSTH